MLVDQYNYYLPEGLIANYPLLPRDHARLLCYEKACGEVKDGHFFDLPNLLKAGDVLVFNKSKVFPARLKWSEGQRKYEVLFLKRESDRWQIMVKPGRHFKLGNEILYMDLRMKIVMIDEEGYRWVEINKTDEQLFNFLDLYGVMPVPPYIKGKEYSGEDYNTVFSEAVGSVAAPTAGLHFTKSLLARLRAKGVIIEYVTLHVGLGTFLPVKEKDLKNHKMHSEVYSIDHFTARRLTTYKAQGKKIIAVGTTVVRTLESNISKTGIFAPGKFTTSIFINEGYDWKVVSGLITNFHLPKSTLLVLVAALIGREKALSLYYLAIKYRMRFYSFGDGMLIF